MALRLVLFDFHFTLTTSPCQLDVEVKTLVSRVLHKLSQRPGSHLKLSNITQLYETADGKYQELRAHLRDSNSALLLVDRADIVLRKLGIKVRRATLEKIVASVMEECLEDIALVPGAKEAVQQLAEDGYKLGVVSSSGYPKSIEDGLRHLGLQSYFSGIIATGSEGLAKSDPELYRRAAIEFGVLPMETANIGDDPTSDVAPAMEAGLKAIWFTGLMEESASVFGRSLEVDRIIGAKADAMVSDMLMIPKVIKQLST
ncbi:MAG TPA: HAD-IA family hydrolase [Chloroflexia bacterium]|nr:HAD-IA family hydrolase [Chloroflexia bacterium]